MSEVCGTGGWTGPKPGDPDNNVVLSATSTFGGISVSWTMPETNPWAVAYTIIYRSLTNNFNSAIEHAIAKGNSYVDVITPNERTTYYYWIVIVSVHGTHGERLGSASATAYPTAEGVLNDIAGRIDEGTLATNLRSDIDRINVNRLDITQEMVDRAKNDDALGIALNEVRAESENNLALITEEQIARTNDFGSLAASINTISVELDNKSTGEEVTSRIQDNNIAMIGYCSLGTDYLDPTSCQNAGGTWLPAAPLAEATRQVEVADGKNVATVEQQMRSYQTEIGNLGSLYTVKVGVDGLVGGFGIYNDGTEVEAGFDVDRFWIGRSSDNGLGHYPFIVDSSGIKFNGRVSFSNVEDTRTLLNDVDNATNRADDAFNRADTAFNKADDATNKADDVDRQLAAWASNNDQTLIDGAKIYTGDAYVDTLQIKGNAVTIPAVNTASHHFSPTDYQDYVSVTIDIDRQAMVYVSFAGSIFYGSGWSETWASLRINNVELQRQGGGEGFVAASLSGALYLARGRYRAHLKFKSAESKGILSSGTIFIMATKR